MRISEVPGKAQGHHIRLRCNVNVEGLIFEMKLGTSPVSPNAGAPGKSGTTGVNTAQVFP